MLPGQQPHVFSHQHQFGPEPAWIHQQQQQQQSHHPQHANHMQHHGPQSQAQQAAQAAAVAQQNHYNRISASNNASGHGQHNGNHNLNSDLGSTASMFSDGNMNEEHRRLVTWVSELLNGNSREQALMELSKKREQVPELALIIWHSFGKSEYNIFPPHSLFLIADLGVMTTLLQEIISVYPLLNPSQLTAAASNRVCNALALLQCVASHNETRGLFLSGKQDTICYNCVC